MYRNSIFILLSLPFLIIFAACAKPDRKTGHDISPTQIRIENLGNGVCREVASGLMWQIAESKQFSTWEKATEYVKTIRLAGFNDWRLPTYNESYQLTELLLMKQKVDCPIKIKGSSWIGNDNKTRKGKAGHWEDYPLCGGPEFSWIKSKKGTVRAVRP